MSKENSVKKTNDIRRYALIPTKKKILSTQEIIIQSLERIGGNNFNKQDQDPNHKNLSFEELYSNKRAVYLKEMNVIFIDLSSTDLELIRNSDLYSIAPSDYVIHKLDGNILSPEEINKKIPANWGLEKLNLLDCKYTGKGVKVGILDSGLDLKHEFFNAAFFKGKNVEFRNYVQIDENYYRNNNIPPVQDFDGHGTHCAGILFGGFYEDKRFGIAYESDIFVGRVLDNNGKGIQEDLIKGIYDAVAWGCTVLSISIGTIDNNSFPKDFVPPVKCPNEIPIEKCLKGRAAYNRAIAHAYSNGCIVVAGVGNNSSRDSIPAQIPSEITSPSDIQNVIAVTAIDYYSKLYDKANQAKLNKDQHIDCAAPGVQVYSTYKSVKKKRDRFEYMNGTSMATPFIAGIIALLQEIHPHYNPSQIIGELYDICFKNDSKHLDIDYGLGIPYWKKKAINLKIKKKMNLSTHINFKDNKTYQAIYASQLYGTFFMIYAKVKTDHTSEKDNYFLEEAELKIINYKGLIDIGITRAEFEDLRGDKMNDYNSKFKIEVRAHYKSSTDDLKVKNINSKQGLPKSKSLLLIDRRVRPMHLDVSKGGTLDDVTNKNAVALKNGIFDTEFFYRDGILENGEYYDRVSPKPEEWDDIVTHNIGLASPRCPRSRITII